MHAHAFGRAAAKDRDDLVGLDALVQATPDFLFGQGSFLEILLQQVVGAFGRALDQLATILLDKVMEFGGHFVGDATSVRSRQVGLALDQVDDSFETGTFADGYRDRNKCHLEALFQLLQHGVEIRSFLVHLVDEHGSGLVAVVQSSPELQGLDLDAELGIDDHQGRLAGTEGADGLANETRGSRSIQKIDLPVIPVKGDEGGMDGNLLRDFLVREIAYSLAAFHRGRLVQGSRLKQELLDQRRLSCTVVPDNGYIPDV